MTQRNTIYNSTNLTGLHLAGPVLSPLLYLSVVTFWLVPMYLVGGELSQQVKCQVTLSTTVGQWHYTLRGNITL